MNETEKAILESLQQIHCDLERGEHFVADDKKESIHEAITMSREGLERRGGSSKPLFSASTVFLVVQSVATAIISGFGVYLTLSDRINNNEHSIEILQREDVRSVEHMKKDEAYMNAFEQNLRDMRIDVNQLINSNASAHRTLNKRIRALEKKK